MTDSKAKAKVTVRFFQGEKVLADLPPRSIALDGAVQGPVMGDAEDRWSFDHHAGCHRLVTAATCEQVYTALALGLEPDGREVWVNDLDGDTILSLWLLLNPEYAQGGDMNARSLVRAVALLDAHGPAGKRLMGVAECRYADAFFSAFRDYSRAGYSQQRFAEWPEMVERAMALVWDVYTGKVAAKVEAPTEVNILHHEGRMVLAEAQGFGGFDALYNQGYAVVALVAPGADGSRVYTIGKVSDLVRFRLGPGKDPDSLLGRLSAREPGWGGGSSIGGSPRLDGGVASRLTPAEVWELITTQGS